MTLAEKSHHFPRGHRQMFFVRQKRDVNVFIWEKIGEVMFDFFLYVFFYNSKILKWKLDVMMSPSFQLIE